MRINVFCGYKGDEMEIGLIEHSAYRPNKWMKGVQQTLVYYGSRKWGGWGHTRSTDTDTGSNLECDCRGTDCYVGGSIQGGPNGVVVHPIPKYEGGDWLTFKIDFDAKTV